MLSAVLANLPNMAEMAGPRQNEKFLALVDAAKKSAFFRLTPYQDSFIHGASIETERDIFAGSGFENAAYKNSVTPLEAAIYAALSAGERSIRSVCIYGLGQLTGAERDLLKNLSTQVDIFFVDNEKGGDRLVASERLAGVGPSIPFTPPNTVSSPIDLAHPHAHKAVSLDWLKEHYPNLPFESLRESFDYSTLQGILVSLAAQRNSLCTQSGYAVGAALVFETGEIVSGSNSEFPNLKLGACAERSAVATAHSHGLLTAFSEEGQPIRGTTPKTIVVSANLPSEGFEGLVTPCGNCLTDLAEVNPDLRVVCVSPNGYVAAYPLIKPGTVIRFSPTGEVESGNGSLAPHLFSRANLGILTRHSTPVFPQRILPSSAEVIADGDGRLYHLQIDRLPNSVITVGDPDRARVLAKEHLSVIEYEVEHRGLYVAYGTTSDGSELAFVTHGMGCGSAEIALVESLLSGSRRSDKKLLYPLETRQKDIVRLGTSGSLNAPLGTLVIADVVVSLSSTALYQGYSPKDDDLLEFQRALRKSMNEWALDQWLKVGAPEEDFQQYPVVAFRTSSQVRDTIAMQAEALGLPYVVGATIEAPGFFAAQGRKVGYYAIGIPDLDERLSQFPEINGTKLQNFEMEGATLANIARGHEVGVACVAVAHRPSNAFATDIAETMDLAGHVIRNSQTSRLRSRNPY